jgi:alpha-mannosidase
VIPSIPLELSALSVRGEPVSFEEAARGSYQRFQVGDSWGPPWSTTWFRVRGRVPDEWAEKRVVALFDLGFTASTGFTCEALAWKDGTPWRGVDPNHRRLPVEGPDFEFYLEASAIPRATESGPEPAPSMLALRESPEPAFTFRQAELMILEPETISGEARLDSTHVITAVGHAHIDTAWEWPLREAKRKVARSWSTQLVLMDEHPDYVFAASQPVQYQWMKESYLTIYERIKEKVAAVQWEPVGAMWVEADCNLPSGESLVRQLLHGQRFFMREFGHETRILWLPDVFGYPGNLPQPWPRLDAISSSLRSCRGTTPTNRSTTLSFGRASTGRASSRTSRPPTRTTATSARRKWLEASTTSKTPGDQTGRFTCSAGATEVAVLSPR